jgi:threonyl-tRNA synthetase
MTSEVEVQPLDHIQIGRDKKLFLRSEMSPGSILWLPYGTKIFNILVDYFKVILKKKNYRLIKTPLLYKPDLWKQTGHWDKYQENMFIVSGKTDEDISFGLKPMNCPGHALIYKDLVTSEMDLPLKLMEFGDVHRNELSNSLTGLFRLRQFTQDDAHIFCTMEQVETEINDIIDYIKKFYSYFGFKYSAELSTRPEQSLGDDDLWASSEEILKKCIPNLDTEFQINEGDGAFYGPKIDITITDSRSRKWQCGTIQLDLNMANTMDLNYAMIGQDNAGQFGKPVVIHRAVLGSVERFIGILLEHYQGSLPFWLDQNQICIIPVNQECNAETFEYLKYLDDIFSDYNVKMDLTTNTFAKKIRNASINGYHYIFIIGDKEVKNGLISYRHDKKQLRDQEVEAVFKTIQSEFDFIN